MSEQETVHSRWWWANALTVILGIFAFIFMSLNIALGGTEWTAQLLVFFWIATLGVGYISIVPFYLDVRRIRSSGVDYDPKVWLYVCGYIFTSPLLASGIYLINRHLVLGVP